MWQANGEVDAMVSVGDRLYIGGEFSYVGPRTGAGAPLSAVSGEPVPGSPRVEGQVFAVVSDGAGGWYIGGRFKRVGGIVRHNLAHVLADDRVDRVWSPGASRPVWALAVSGSTVYVGGDFKALGGRNRDHIAALNAKTGQVTAWNPGANLAVGALAVSGSTVYAGGRFTAIGGRRRSHIAALTATTGRATAWDPNADREVEALTASHSTVYAGGRFKTIGGQARSHIAAIDATSGQATAWNPDANGAVFALAVSAATVYAGGDFKTIGGARRKHIAAIDAAAGRATGWNPDASNEVDALALSGSTVYAGGLFSAIGGRQRSQIAALDMTTGHATAWNPEANGAVWALAASGSTVYAGGWFGFIGGEKRNGLAALNTTTGKLTSWNPNLGVEVCCGFGVRALAVSGSTIYVGGSFSSIGGHPRSDLAAVHATTGRVTAWNPDPSDPQYGVTVRALAAVGSTVYVGGNFSSIGGQTRNGIAALDATTGQATSWNPSTFDSPVLPQVDALAVSGPTVYAGGYFGSIGGQARNNIAALDATTGEATGWNPNANGQVAALAVSGPTVYAVGRFTSIFDASPSIGGQQRNGIVALDATTGQATAWNPDAHGGYEGGPVFALAVGAGTVYAGGYFTTIGGRTRHGLAALDASIGQATTWNPHVNASGSYRYAVSALAVSGSTIYVGGNFSSIAGRLCSNLAALEITS
jgi:hypothetical protein